MKVLFVCTANICRSVMAEGILMKLLTDCTDSHAIIAASAGLDALEGYTPDRTTTEVCNKRKVHIDSHKAQQLTKAMLKEADIVLCMEKIHKQRILGAFPKLIKKVFLLKEYLHQNSLGNAEVKDPTGKSIIHYQKCFHEIEKEVQRILPFILKNASQI
jgi:protein-tyrosine-phosphatase